MTKNEIIEKLKPRCNGYDLPLSLNIALVAEILVGENDILHDVRQHAIDFNYKWPDAPIEMKEAFANEHGKKLNDYIHEYDLMNMWYAKRYWLGIDD